MSAVSTENKHAKISYGASVRNCTRGLTKRDDTVRATCLFENKMKANVDCLQSKGILTAKEVEIIAL